MKKKAKKQLPDAAERVKRTGSGMAAATRGRARTFTDRKKEADRNKCRGKVEE